jgi:hypothetical protein
MDSWGLITHWFLNTDSLGIFLQDRIKNYSFPCDEVPLMDQSQYVCLCDRLFDHLLVNTLIYHHILNALNHHHIINIHIDRHILNRHFDYVHVNIHIDLQILNRYFDRCIVNHTSRFHFYNRLLRAHDT